MNEQDNTAEHRQAQELLPWFVNATLEADERELVQAHVDACPRCRADVAWQRTWRATEPAAPNLDVEAALARLPALPPRPAATTPPVVAPWRRGWARLRGGQPWMPWALAAQCALIAVLALQPPQQQPPPQPGEAGYRALGAAGQSGPNLVVVFRPDARLGDVHRILRASAVRIVDGPTVTDAYLLEAGEARLAQTVAALRAEPAVQLVEALSAPAQP